MSTRRRIGVSAATTEAARRALMQPVTCWEKVWVTPENSPGSKLKIYRWVKTDKVQQFSDEEGTVDEPLAPLPDEPEVVDGDEEDQEEPQTVPASARATEPPEAQGAPSRGPESEEASKPPSPKGAQLSLQMNSGLEESFGADASGGLDVMNDEGKMDIGVGESGGMQLDMSALGPDGLELEGTHNMTQLDGDDALMGGPMMDNTLDPFVGENQ
ncbi:hypothetical protein K435DRAFT_262004 [Dendrothele bispora CBS 962.96]|uniref:Uncharacterized protein n=1 Tax=Dendrothele bispora (strain CBS 962.96) TaxID=1314807 RepID=A0A4S8MW92_DENBC|nr:hypothetical protein K435DRAFT_262004 [Dendrothele bispora CBS 962.96]